jgi:hypothetical protein
MMSHLSMGGMVDGRKRGTEGIHIIDDEPMVLLMHSYALSG